MLTLIPTIRLAFELYGAFTVGRDLSRLFNSSSTRTRIKKNEPADERDDNNQKIDQRQQQQQRTQRLTTLCVLPHEIICRIWDELNVADRISLNIALPVDLRVKSTSISTSETDRILLPLFSTVRRSATAVLSTSRRPSDNSDVTEETDDDRRQEFEEERRIVIECARLMAPFLNNGDSTRLDIENLISRLARLAPSLSSSSLPRLPPADVFAHSAPTRQPPPPPPLASSSTTTDGGDLRATAAANIEAAEKKKKEHLRRSVIDDITRDVTQRKYRFDLAIIGKMFSPDEFDNLVRAVREADVEENFFSRLNYELVLNGALIVDNMSLLHHLANPSSPYAETTHSRLESLIDKKALNSLHLCHIRNYVRVPRVVWLSHIQSNTESIIKSAKNLKLNEEKEDGFNQHELLMKFDCENLRLACINLSKG